MKIIIRIFVVLIVVVLIIGGIFAAYKITGEQRTKNAVNSGLIKIDQEMHEWGTCKNDIPVKITLYIRNGSKYKVDGVLVFSATLSKEGIEEKFINKFIDCFGEEKLKREFKEEIEKNGSIGRLMAVFKYLNRGKKLPQGKNFEPTGNFPNVKEYKFKFRKRLLILPGEITKIKHEEQLPLNVRGQILSLKIESIEF